MITSPVRLVLFTERPATVLRLLGDWVPPEVVVRSACGPRSLRLELSGEGAESVADSIRDWFDARFRWLKGGVT